MKKVGKRLMNHWNSVSKHTTFQLQWENNHTSYCVVVGYLCGVVNFMMPLSIQPQPLLDCGKWM